MKAQQQLGSAGERTITLLGERPITWNQFNGRKHWSKRAAEAKRVHELVYTEVYLDDPVDYPVHITVTVYFKSHWQDCCNIRAKTYIDGLIGYWVVDDDPRYVEKVTTISRKDKDNPRVVITMSKSITPERAKELDMEVLK